MDDGGFSDLSIEKEVSDHFSGSGADGFSRKPGKLYNSDYLIGVYDETRMGGLRFKEDPDGPFLSDDREAAIPKATVIDEKGCLWIAKLPSRHDENDTGAWCQTKG